MIKDEIRGHFISLHFVMYNLYRLSSTNRYEHLHITQLLKTNDAVKNHLVLPPLRTKIPQCPGHLDDGVRDGTGTS